jgi:hypothetical protein
MTTELHKKAIESIESTSRIYKVQFKISYYTVKIQVGLNSGNWVINVMGKKFMNRDFVEAAREAVKFCYNAHEAKKIK